MPKIIASPNTMSASKMEAKTFLVSPIAWITVAVKNFSPSRRLRPPLRRSCAIARWILWRDDSENNLYTGDLGLFNCSSSRLTTAGFERDRPKSEFNLD
jgi:hypothetical protein